MRLKCDIQVFNRLQSFCNIPSKRSEWSYLTIGFYTSNSREIYILHQTQKNSIGVKYKVIGNLGGLFINYISEGKATIRFKKPSHDLIIRSSSEQLRKFCLILQHILKDGIDDKLMSSLSNLNEVPKKISPKAKTKFYAKSKKDISSVDPFPRTLEVLQINNASLTQLDGRIFRLQRLKVIKLENNCLETLPEQLSLLPCLKELHLAGNFLGRTPIGRWLLMDTFQSNLTYLDLRHNEIHKLPNEIYKLKKLKTLLLNNNILFNLPNAFGRLVSLKELRLSNNKITVLPASFRFLFLDVLDISCNPGWLRNFPTYPTELLDTSNFVSLREISARAVLNNRLEFGEKTLPRVLIAYLDNACYCVCGQATFPSKPERYIKFEVERICVEVTFTACNLPIEVRFCSNRCRTAYSYF